MEFLVLMEMLDYVHREHQDLTEFQERRASLESLVRVSGSAQSHWNSRLASSS